MNNKYLLIGAFVLVGIGTAAYFVTASPKTVTAPITTETDNTAWIEVKSDAVFLTVGELQTPLNDGDTLQAGDTIETDTTGGATIHFPDGSVARVDGNTKLTLSEISFNKQDHSLVVSLGLAVGRVWSKVIGLATPQSSWQVKTSNTVATVRGTAFGVTYKAGTSYVIGSEHTVGVAPVDPRNNKPNFRAEIALGEDKLIKITNQDAAAASTAVGSSTISTKVTGVPKEFSDDPWVKGNKSQDIQFDASVHASADIKTTPVKTTGTVKTDANVTASPTTEPVKATAANAKVTASRSLTDLTEGDSVQFKMVVGTGSSARDITKEVKWSVTGSIGTVSTGGLFTALLGADISEFGEGTGSVTATLPDGEVVQGPTIHVQAKVEIELNPQG